MVVAGRRPAVTKGAIVAVIITVLAVLVAVAAVSYSFSRAPFSAVRTNITTAQLPKLKVVWKTDPLVDKKWLIQRGLYIRSWTWYSFLKGSVVSSPDGRFVAVTTQKGEIFVFSSNGKKIKDLTFGLGRVPYSMAFSPDGKYFAVGLSSRYGEVLVYDTNDWKTVWSYKADKDLLGPSNATEATITKSPWYGNMINFIRFDSSGKRLYFVADGKIISGKSQRPVYKKVSADLMKIYPDIREKYSNLKEYRISMWVGVYASRLVAVNVDTWKVVWRWPEDGPSGVMIPMFATDSKDRYMALCTWWGYSPEEPARWHGGTIFVLRASDGSTLWRWDIPPRVPMFNRTNIWNGIGISSDGKYVVVEPSDGRIFVINNGKSVKEGKPVIAWKATIMSPIESEVLLIPVKGGNYTSIKSYIYAGTYFAGILGDKIIPYSSATYSVYWNPKYERKPMVQHPNQTKLFMFDLNTGDLLYIDKFFGKPMYGKVVPFARDGNLLIGCVGNDWITSDASMSGVYVWDTSRLKLVTRFLTLIPEKYGVPLDVSASGKRIYVLVGPVDLATGPAGPSKIVGEYRLIALELGS